VIDVNLLGSSYCQRFFLLSQVVTIVASFSSVTVLGYISKSKAGIFLPNFQNLTNFTRTTPIKVSKLSSCSSNSHSI
jgi:hypothetical protein